MRQIVSSGSVKAIFLDREDTLKTLQKISSKALRKFPEIKEIRLFGSLAKGEGTGLSDIDIFLLVVSEENGNPIERMKPYFNFFSDRMDIAVDMIVATENELGNFKDILKESILIKKAD
jgi:predicted nucleotidyltransferase